MHNVNLPAHRVIISSACDLMMLLPFLTSVTCSLSERVMLLFMTPNSGTQHALAKQTHQSVHLSLQK